jgi:D-isomer specific 2-hydroxyacid dehydrogenase, NAD binding domain
MALAAAKRLILEHENLKLGQFNQFTQNRMLAGGVCGIFGFGGIGAATARLMHGIGMRVHAINRHGRTDERVDWIGTPERLNDLLEAADVLLISAPLTRVTYGLIGAAELGRMKNNAILVNLARGEIVQERPLYDHLERAVVGFEPGTLVSRVNAFFRWRLSARAPSADCSSSWYSAHASHRFAIWLQVALSAASRVEEAIPRHSWACRRKVSERSIADAL